MKTLVLAPSIEGTGGIQRYVSTLVASLRQLLGEDSVRLLAIPHEPRQESVGQERLSLTVRLHFAAQALKLAARWRPDLVICAHVGIAPLAWLLRLLFGAPYWVVAYGIEVWGALPFLKRAALARTDCLVAISAFTQHEVIQRHRLPAERTCVLPPALESGHPSPGGERAAVPVPEGERIVLTVGRLAASERYKGHDVVLRAWSSVREKVPNAAYLIVGDGDDRPRLEALAHELGLADSVCFAGAITHDALAACYQACDVFVLPARTVLDKHSPQGEGFGIVFLEALAYGKPVVGPKVGAPAEFICHEEHGLLVDPHSPAQVADALVRLLTQPDLARRLGEQGRRYVEENYRQDALLRRLRYLLNLPQGKE